MGTTASRACAAAPDPGPKSREAPWLRRAGTAGHSGPLVPPCPLDEVSHDVRGERHRRRYSGRCGRPRERDPPKTISNAMLAGASGQAGRWHSRQMVQQAKAHDHDYAGDDVGTHRRALPPRDVQLDDDEHREEPRAGAVACPRSSVAGAAAARRRGVGGLPQSISESVSAVCFVPMAWGIVPLAPVAAARAARAQPQVHVREPAMGRRGRVQRPGQCGTHAARLPPRPGVLHVLHGQVRVRIRVKGGRKARGRG